MTCHRPHQSQNLLQRCTSDHNWPEIAAAPKTLPLMKIALQGNLAVAARLGLLFTSIAVASPAFAQEAMERPSNLPSPLTASDFPAVDAELAKLGQLLFFDPLLSGNKNIACSTCHNPEFGSADGLSLGLGEGGLGVGTMRQPGQGASRIHKRIPRNAPALWNMGALEINKMFHDGRLSRSDALDSGFDTPAKDKLPLGLDSPLAAQALFPLAADAEMAGDPGENAIADAAVGDIQRVWELVAQRVGGNPGYAQRFAAVYENVDAPDDITITEIANAIAAFEASEYQSIDSPFDAYLAGDEAALTPEQKTGMHLFYGEAGCSACHSGALFSDQEFHALMLPAFGPGRPVGNDPTPRDIGRMAVTAAAKDAYRFRTLPLRNLTLTAPYGHNGAYQDLADMVRHHLQPRQGFAAWTPDKAVLSPVDWLADSDFKPLEDTAERARIAGELDLAPRQLSEEDIARLVAFLESLTGTASIAGRLGAPESVPSGLAVD